MGICICLQKGYLGTLASQLPSWLEFYQFNTDALVPGDFTGWLFTLPGRLFPQISMWYIPPPKRPSQ